MKMPEIKRPVDQPALRGAQELLDPLAAISLLIPNTYFFPVRIRHFAIGFEVLGCLQDSVPGFGEVPVPPKIATGGGEPGG